MFQKNIIIALRTLRKNKIYSTVTLIGLTAGIAAALLIFRMVSYELSFNKNFENYERIVRVVSSETDASGKLNSETCTPLPAMDMIQQTVSQFETMSRVHELWAPISLPDPQGGPPLKKFNMGAGETAFFVEPSFFKIFNAQWLAGNPETALTAPNVIVLTETFAKKYFDQPVAAIGQHLVLDYLVTVTVTGIIADLPVNCDFPAPYFSSWETFKAHPDHFFYDNNWGSCSSNNQIYALLNDPSQTDAANLALAKVGEERNKEEGRSNTKTYFVQPLSDLHFNEELGNSGTHRVSKSRLRILGGIGILTLLMACFNFINLATAQSSLRAKEVGVRKTLGGGQWQLAWLFLSETGVIVALALVLGAGLASVCSPLLKLVSDVPDELPFFTNPAVWGFLVIIGVAVTLLAGLYPSLSLASFKPMAALRSNLNPGKYNGVALRKSLVVLQFVIAQVLIIGAIITLMQLDFIRSRDLGFSKNLVYNFGVGSDSSSQTRHKVLKQELLKIPTLESVSFSNDQPLSGNTWSSNFRFASRPEDEKFPLTHKFCDADYQKTYGIRMLAGKWFEPSDTIRQGVVNLTFARKLGITDPQEVIGQTLYIGGRRPVEITGVTDDFHAHSLHEEHQAVLLAPRAVFYWDIGVKIRPDNIAGSLAALQHAFDKVMPEQVFEGRFLDDSIAQFYENDNRLAATCKGFGLLAILISCLGLFGLATHAAQQRVKEIGVRKVLGATVANIVSLLSKDFLKLVAVALVIAAPLAYFFMDKWLQDFAYRIDIQWWVFLLAGFVAVLVAFLTVSYQSVKAALANPVKSLRSE
ncbi:MAG: ABC transporter permease [Saprospiraceae bacterium]|nr:ABC transporter permease [Saprospiraceae bacterium]MCF8248568.1 ABC transporter permease [Saprospiraceae bacterium]MCF8280265.1 ABC transporter permease [Bacteroidales bacterium]MCF8310301.1 ABC transporter permease [Saprospiraceae bacterium]MCF8439259.1 ABC transporter permease [Saprospiraceae bacterium]